MKYLFILRLQKCVFFKFFYCSFLINKTEKPFTWRFFSVKSPNVLPKSRAAVLWCCQWFVVLVAGLPIKRPWRVNKSTLNHPDFSGLAVISENDSPFTNEPKNMNKKDSAWFRAATRSKTAKKAVMPGYRKVHIFWGGCKFLWNIHSRFVLCSAKFGDLLRIYELSRMRWQFNSGYVMAVLPA